MQGLSRRGLHRTALEVCKLLLALNGDDPLGALCTIDYLALRAGRCAQRSSGSAALPPSRPRVLPLWLLHLPPSTPALAPAPCRYDFLYRLVEQYGGDSSAALLPNFVFSQALARWFQEQGGCLPAWAWYCRGWAWYCRGCLLPSGGAVLRRDVPASCTAGLACGGLEAWRASMAGVNCRQHSDSGWRCCCRAPPCCRGLFRRKGARRRRR